MAVYWLTFRLETDATYNDRYDKLIEAVDILSTRWWVEPSSFLLFESGNKIDEIARAVKTAITPSKDLVLIGMPEIKSARVIGKVTDQTLFDLMPFTKKA